MKRIIPILMIFLILSFACSLPSGKNDSSVETEETPQSQKKCGDGVCNGPENASNCPSDCQQEGEEEPMEGDSGEVVWGYVFSRAVLDRTMGSGDCGIEPWTPSNCMGSPVHWWGMHLEGVINQSVLIIPDGENRWVITNLHEVVTGYGYSVEDFDHGGNYYQAATVDPSMTAGCTASIKGEPFNMKISGERVNDEITLIFSGTPTEIMSGNCSGKDFSWEIHNLLYGWAAAMSGDPVDMTAVLGEGDKQAQEGIYGKHFVVDTNPSPEKRDHVEVNLEFWCVKKVEGGGDPTACPWDR